MNIIKVNQFCWLAGGGRYPTFACCTCFRLGLCSRNVRKLLVFGALVHKLTVAKYILVDWSLGDDIYLLFVGRVVFVTMNDSCTYGHYSNKVVSLLEQKLDVDSFNFP